MKRSAAIRETLTGAVDRDVLLFTVGSDTIWDAVLAEADCIGGAAHVTMLAAIAPKLFTRRERDKVVAELIGIIRNARRGEFKISESDQDVHLAVERILTHKLGELGRKIHTARSRNDQIAVDLRLYGREQLLHIMDEALALAGALLRIARKHALAPMVGRTHMQPAMPSSVGLWASAHAESLLDDLILLVGAYDYNDRCPLGSAAGYGVTLNIDRKLTARLLGFKTAHENVLCAGNARGKCELAALSAAGQIMLSLSRMAADLIVYSMPEFGYFELPREYCTGSSIMPQKNNPDALELIRARTSRALAHCAAVSGIVSGLPSGYSRDLQETKEPFIQGICLTRGSLRIFSRLMGKLKVNRKALLAGFSPRVFAADRVLELVSRGMAFRDAYNRVKGNLEELNRIDPIKAAAARSDAGAPAGVDMAALAERAKRAEKFVKKERSRYYRAISKLLNEKYPELNGTT